MLLTARERPTRVSSCAATTARATTAAATATFAPAARRADQAATTTPTCLRSCQPRLHSKQFDFVFVPKQFLFRMFEPSSPAETHTRNDLPRNVSELALQLLCFFACFALFLCAHDYFFGTGSRSLLFFAIFCHASEQLIPEPLIHGHAHWSQV